ncbi:MAG: PorV/PorQ family protein [bacterium]
MRITQFTLALLGCLLFITAEAAFAVSDAAVLFLRIAPGARSAGMGEAFVAVADDASATHWNPAGLGEYPLADSWYQFKLSDDSRLKSLARKALDGKLADDFLENYQSWQVKGNSVGRFVDGEWRYAETISIDPARDFLTTLARLARVDDKELFKRATRAICYQHSGISFEDINDMRVNLLAATKSSPALGDRVNAMLENILVLWQDLRLDLNSYDAFTVQASSFIEGGLVDEAAVGTLEQMATACELAQRPSEISVPYPVLLSTWRSWEVPWEESIEKIVVVENSVPNDNYTHYDVWAITNFGLKHFDGLGWQDGMSSASAEGLIINKGDGIKEVIARVLGTSNEEVILSRLETVAQANNTISRDGLREFTARFKAALPAEFKSREELLASLDVFDQAWLDCLIDDARLEELTNSFRQSNADSTLTEAELDRLLFAAGKVVRSQLVQPIQVPFSAILQGELYDVAVDRKLLLVATSTGLYQFNGRTWQKMSTGVENEPVYCVESVKRGRYWIGTDTGVKRYEQSQWTSYGRAEGIIEGPIKHILALNEHSAWAASDRDLYNFNGTSWLNQHVYTTSVTDSAKSVLTRFYGPLDQIAIEQQLSIIQMAHPEFYENPEAGVQIRLPFRSVFESDITSLAVDNSGGLWVGTELGIKYFDGDGWRSFGYKPIVLERDMTIDELASEYLKTSDPEKIAGFVSILKRKNTIQIGTLPKGRVVYVYDNPAGSPINKVYRHGGRMYFASLYGTFSYNDGTWERYYHEGLHDTATKDIVGSAGELWFATSDRVIVFAHGKKEFSFTHSKWLPELAEDLYYEFFTYVQPVGGLGTVGANITFLSFGEIARTSENNPEILETFSSFDGALSLSYGIRASRNMAIGLSARIIYSKLADQGAGAEIGRGSGTSFAVDAGVIYHFSKKFNLGAALTNLGPDMSYIDAAQSDPLPRNLAVGIAYKLLDSPYNRLTLVGEANKMLATLNDDFSTEIKEIITSVGLEYWYGSLLALRSGYYIDTEGESKYLTVGVGLQFKDKYRIDFAYIPTSEQHVLGNTLRTSLTVRL